MGWRRKSELPSSVNRVILELGRSRVKSVGPAIVSAQLSGGVEEDYFTAENAEIAECTKRTAVCAVPLLCALRVLGGEAIFCCLPV